MSATSPTKDTTRAKLEAIRACLNRALDLVPQLNHAFDRVPLLDGPPGPVPHLNIALALELDLTIRRASALARDRGFALNIRFDRAGAVNIRLNLFPDRALDRALRRAYALASNLARDLKLDRDLFVLAFRVRGSLEELVEVVKDAHARTTALEAAISAETNDAEPLRERSNMAVSRTAVRVAVWSVWVLPPADRTRYDEELRSELRDLAASGATRRAQLQHAVQILTRAWQLRGALKKAQSRRAVS